MTELSRAGYTGTRVSITGNLIVPGPEYDDEPDEDFNSEDILERLLADAKIPCPK